MFSLLKLFMTISDYLFRIVSQTAIMNVFYEKNMSVQNGFMERKKSHFIREFKRVVAFNPKIDQQY